MKILNLFILFVTVLVSINGMAQKSKSFVGYISYDIKTLGEVEPAMAAQLPTENLVYFNGAKTRIEQKSAMGSTVIISNIETKEQIVLIDIMGQKYALKSSKEETENAQSQIPKGTVTMGTETKTIAGYNCKKADFTQDGKTSAIWITDEINLNNSNWQTQYKDVEGVMLEYNQITGQEGEINLLITAKEVKKEKVKDSMFTVPAGYQEMSLTEFKKMFGGGQ